MKIVRDNIIKIIKNDNKEVEYAIVNDRVATIFLSDKIMEEGRELQEAIEEAIDGKEKQNVIEEIGDLLEVLEALCDKLNIDMQEVKKVKKEKAMIKGKFNANIILK